MKIKSPLLLFLSCLLAASTFAQSLAPIEFTENKGQWDSRVQFKADVAGGALFLHKNGYTVVQNNEKDWQQLVERIHHHNESDTRREAPLVVHSHAYRVEFEDASPKATVIADKALTTYTNYFIGDQSNWASHCRIYQGITIANIYPNIDARYYSDNGVMKYDLIVKPGGNVADIRLKYIGADGLEIKDKLLHVKTSIGTVREMSPYSYQYTIKGRQEVKAAYKLKGDAVSFDIKNYDKEQTLIIDPTMIFASFSKSTAENWGYTATYGADGSMFGGGIVFNQGFPVSTGAFQTSFTGGNGTDNYDIGIIKLTPDGSNRVYATYIGGNGADQPHSLIADDAGNLIIAGRTNSAIYTSGQTTNNQAFPLKNGAADQIGTDLKQYDIIVVKLNADGTNLIGSARIGGSGDDGVNGNPGHASSGTLKLNYGDDGRSEVILDASGNIYVASCTQSSNFPVSNNAFQQSFGKGTQDAVVLKFSPAVTRVFSSYLGGDDDDGAFVLSLNPATSDIYVGGGTRSANFPGRDAISMDATLGGIDGFVSMISNDGSTLKRSTFVGTDATDIIWGLKFDRMGFPYVTGQTLGKWKITTAWGQEDSRQFISKLKPDLSGTVYSTSFGTSGANAPNISPVAFLVDRCENVYVSGWGGTISGAPRSAGTIGLKTTSDALVMNPPYSTPNQTDGGDFYFFVLKRDGVSQLYGSFYGQNGGFVDHVDGGTSRFDENGIIYQAICANCSPNPHPYYPTTPGVWGTTNPGPDCNLAMVKIAMNLSGIHSGVQSSINGVPRDTAGCVPLTVDFQDTVLNAVSYEWDFDGDGINDTTTVDPRASHTYYQVRNYKVRLIAIDSSSCNIRDTSYMTVKVGDLQALPNFTSTKLEPCQSLNYRFDNISVAPAAKPFTNTSFVWDFGDGTSRVTAGGNSITHTFANAGSYQVRLYLVDTSYCNAPDSSVHLLNIATTLKAAFETASVGCSPYQALFKNLSAGGQQFTWDFGDGTVVTNAGGDTISHFYQFPGTYLVRLKVIDSATCNKEDSASFTIRTIAKPTAAIGTVTPQPPIVNTPLTFPNASSPDAVQFKWFFGDGDSVLTNSPVPVKHDYNASKTYNVSLIAYNSNGCSDTARTTVQTLVEPALDVPNAFTPLSGGINSIVMPKGFGIGKMKFTIYNRWGQKLFETENTKEGWDGKYKGVIQPMDVYVYTLDVEFTDGTKASKKGDITLIR